MSLPNPENDDKKDKGLEEYYHFDKATDKELEYISNRSYFEHVKSLIPIVKQVQKKVDKIRKQLRKKIKELELAAKNKQKNTKASQKNNSKSHMIQEDLAFCIGALSEGNVVKAEVDKNLDTLKEILKIKEKRNFSVIVDVALHPLPSDRAKNRQNGNDSKNQSNGTSGKLTPEQLAALRGVPEKKTSVGDNKDPVAVSENSDVNAPKKVMTAADKDKILAARNGIAPEDIGKEKPKRSANSNNIDFSRMPLSFRDRSPSR